MASTVGRGIGTEYDDIRIRNQNASGSYGSGIGLRLRLQQCIQFGTNFGLRSAMVNVHGLAARRSDLL
jgi:hypothetical protein